MKIFKVKFLTKLFNLKEICKLFNIKLNFNKLYLEIILLKIIN